MQRRREMVQMIRRGHSQRAVARKFHVALRTVQRWVDRAGDLRLEAVDWSNRAKIAHRVANKTSADLEQRVCQMRKQLATTGALCKCQSSLLTQTCAGHDQLAMYSLRLKIRAIRVKPVKGS